MRVGVVGVGVGVGATTVRVTAGLVTPDMDAVMLVFPAATPVAKPVEEIVAIVGVRTGPGYLRGDIRIRAVGVGPGSCKLLGGTHRQIRR